MYRVFIHRSTESLGQYTGKIAGKGAFLKTDFCLNLWLNWRWSEQISKKIFKNSTLFRERQITQAMARAISRTLKFIGTLSKILKKNSFDLKYPKLVLADKGKFPFASAKNEQNAQLPESLSTAICGFIRQCSNSTAAADSSEPGQLPGRSAAFVGTVLFTKPWAGPREPWSVTGV